MRDEKSSPRGLLYWFSLGHLANDWAPSTVWILAPALAVSMNLSPAEVGLLITIAHFGSALAYLPAGLLADRLPESQGCLTQTFPRPSGVAHRHLELDINKREPVLAAAVAGGQNAPIFTREAHTQLLVRDGGTTVIAGIYQINDQDNENRVPFLGKVPVIKYLFKKYHEQARGKLK